MKEYIVEFQQYAVNIKLKPLCNSVTFINAGTADVQIKGLTLLPNQSISIEGNENEIDTTDYDINFPNSNAAGNILWVVVKRYK